jgi:hypothetical protein
MRSDSRTLHAYEGYNVPVHFWGSSRARCGIAVQPIVRPGSHDNPRPRPRQGMSGEPRRFEVGPTLVRRFAVERLCRPPSPRAWLVP